MIEPSGNISSQKMNINIGTAAFACSGFATNDKKERRPAFPHAQKD
ncbi:hypothetical protein CHCC20335_3492 [Bacillus paralicheniformis]|nr:hypothetical protein CHCC20335_3492 [Bacillus paralicheniformis]